MRGLGLLQGHFRHFLSIPFPQVVAEISCTGEPLCRILFAYVFESFIDN